MKRKIYRAEVAIVVVLPSFLGEGASRPSRTMKIHWVRKNAKTMLGILEVFLFANGT